MSADFPLGLVLANLDETHFLIGQAKARFPHLFKFDKQGSFAVDSASYLYYVGAKDKVVAEIAHHVPFGLKRLIEPFCGSGAVATALAHRFIHLELGDANADLVMPQTGWQF